MSRVESRPLHGALIPWVIALVAMLGLNSLAPELARSARRDAPDGIKPTELAQQTPAGSGAIEWNQGPQSGRSFSEH
jgi:hypothetical protein